jgi:hypothetical protein
MDHKSEKEQDVHHGMLDNLVSTIGFVIFLLSQVAVATNL